MGKKPLLNLVVRITNYTSTPYRFDLPYVLPEILNSHGESMQKLQIKMLQEKVEESDIPLIMPGDSLDFLINTKLSWYRRKLSTTFRQCYLWSYLEFLEHSDWYNIKLD